MSLETELECSTLGRWADLDSPGDLYAIRELLTESYLLAKLERDLAEIVALGELIAVIDDEVAYRRVMRWKVPRNG